MNKINNKRVIFDLLDDNTIVDITEGILKNNNLEESNEEYFKKATTGQEPRARIIRDTALVMVQKKIPEEKLVELLEKHLEIKKNVAENIIKEINEKLIPFAKVIDEEKEAEIRKQQEETKRQQEELEEKSKNQEEINEQQKQEAFARAKDELLRKLRLEHGIEEPKLKEIPNTNVKAVPIADVEDNAKLIEHQQEKDVALPAEKVEEKVDPYKESVE